MKTKPSYHLNIYSKKPFICKVCGKGKEIFGHVKNQLYCSDTCRYVAIKARSGGSKKCISVEKESFPKMRIEGCGHVVNLHFDPKIVKNRMSLKNVRCQKRECRNKKIYGVS